MIEKIKFGEKTISRAEGKSEDIIVSEDIFALIISLQELTEAINKVSRGRK